MEPFVRDVILLFTTETRLLNDVQHGIVPQRAPVANQLSAQLDVSTLLF